LPFNDAIHRFEQTRTGVQNAAAEIEVEVELKPPDTRPTETVETVSPELVAR
jgi:hypothetical protein